ncbi:2-hydroxyisocaproyl-CoA dehydratase activator [Moorella thermoacetica]|uniref:2-hydroxyisocaproyl-CoA dehydratase activator n=1 Tax=Neomoorella thermoacetica TaxID=1525 RepID=A0A1D7XB77_NEOTH|nr:acyl-CoA dehydratase activase [Moorella thermoacetica]AOQ24144.1 R-phenyllactate dehydratase activator [Moorella thermoacetica]OIQ08037.1 R-phenyllactate dehydratase activator [Moorella thermoacetica]OIQ11429.1 R-phenyllactate dehydratase activator [Moorella thermoacetica]OIQ61389.1 R-phenyllactate dehydratase activator [Moorella thermoacetica]TYL14550.1 2-hydroxyisocaproyl-CoA dehydratase activator [Moorella thermoacetica]
MLVVGIDVGSTSAKAVLFDGRIKVYAIRPTGWSPREAGAEVLAEILDKAGLSRREVAYIVGTGYGRVALNFIDQAVTEITCQARGINYLTGKAGTIIDIGGQDTKVITVNEQGKVVDFVMNDKCAAGTGRFLEVMATAMGMDVDELGSLPKNVNPVNISSMCTVFAESEVISLLAGGVAREEIVAGLHRAVARRVKSMLKNTAPATVVFTGGGAKNEGLRRALAAELGVEVMVPAEPQITGALGAAIIAWEGNGGAVAHN